MAGQRVGTESMDVGADGGFSGWLQRSPPIVLIVATIVAYGAGSRLAFELADASGSQAVLFIPAGITVGVLLLSPTPRWPLVLAAGAIAEVALDLDAGLSVGASIGFALANTAEPTIGAILTRRWCGRVELTRINHVVAFVVGAAVIGPACGALIGALVDAIASSGDFWTTFSQWWLGDAIGVVVIGTLIVSSVAQPDRRRTFSPFGIGLLLASIVLTIALLTFSDLPILFLVLVGVVAAGAQFGSRMVSLTATAVAITVAVDFAFDDTQRVVGVSQSTALVLVQLQLGIFTMAGLIVAAEAHERERAVRTVTANQQAEASRRNLRNLIDSLFINVGIATPDGVLTDANMREYEISGTTPASALGRKFWELPSWSYDPNVAALLRHEIEQATATKQTRRFDIDAQFVPGLVPLDFQIVPVLDDDGNVEHLVMSSLDITQRRRDESELAAALDRQRDIVGRLQRSLLPESLPQLDDIRIAAVYRSSIHDLEVGGDWYDAFHLDEHRIAFVIGDIVGRGIDAAGATGQLRSATRAIAATARGPSDVIARLDRFAAAIPAAVAATMLYLELDLRTFEISFCRAGHIPPLVCNIGRMPTFHEEQVSPPLATVLDVDRPEAHLVLEPGSLLLMCTDGLIERRSESIDAGLLRLSEVAQRFFAAAHAEAASDGLANVLESIADELTSDAHATNDDLCILGIHHIGTTTAQP